MGVTCRLAVMGTFALAMGSCTSLHTIQKPNNVQASGMPKNIIFLIGDGMGPEYIRAARIYNGQKPLQFEEFACQTKVTTCSYEGKNEDGTCDKSSPYVTDSAASATAIATGAKVSNGVVSRRLPGDKSDIKTILEMSKAQGKSTGIVTTKLFTDATPAAFAAHADNRSHTEVILKGIFEETTPNVVFGADVESHRQMGKKAIVPYHFVHDATSLTGILKNPLFQKDCTSSDCPHIYGGFGQYPMVLGTDLRVEGLPLEISSSEMYEKKGIPHLSHMTEVALNVLSKNKDNGFFVMVESGMLDIIGHANTQIDRHKNVPSAITMLVREMLEFQQTVNVIANFMKDNPDTLLVITADHETGGLVIDDQKTTCLGQEHCVPTVRWTSSKYDDSPKSLSRHTAVDVSLYAHGKGAEQFCKQSMNNTDIISLAISNVQ